MFTNRRQLVTACRWRPVMLVVQLVPASCLPINATKWRTGRTDKDVAVGSTAPRAAALYGIAHSSPLLLLKNLHCNMKLCCEQACAFLLSSFLYPLWRRVVIVLRIKLLPSNEIALVKRTSWSSC
jgi:hypothetical protein